MIRQATEKDDVTVVVNLINVAYKIGEKGIIVDSDEFPFFRMREQDVIDLISNSNLMVLEKDDNIIGCVKLNFNIEKTAEGHRVGEWGGLAVHPDFQKQGYGSMLQSAAENRLLEAECEYAQLELLTPSNWTHDHKERLRSWYVNKLGYALKVTGEYAKSTTSLPEGTMLLGRFLLATAADFTIYHKKI